MPDSTSRVAEAGEGPQPTNSGAALDPLTRYLLWAVYAGVILFLVGVAYALWFGVLNPPAPRTFEERRLALLENLSKEQSATAEVWADYAAVLIATEQYSRAAAILEQGKAQTKNDPLLLASEAALAAARGRDDQAIVLADRAIKAAAEAREKEVVALTDKGINVALKDIPSPALVAAAVVKGDVATRGEKWQVAADAYTTALEVDPRMSDVLTRRGDAHAALGDTSSAEADYRAALVFIPDSESALEGLKRIGASK